MPRNRAGAQLAINAPPDLLNRLRLAAEAQRRTVTAVVVEAIEAALSGAPAAAPPAVADPVGPALLERLERLEVALAQLQQTPPAAPVPSDPPPPAPERVEPLRVPLGPGHLEVIGAAHLQPPAPAPVPLDPPPLPERRLTPEEAAGLLPLRDVAEALGVVPSAITNWAARQAGKRAGNPAGAIYRGGHRLRGKGLLPGAVKPGWLFDRVAPAA
jgi:hypothetical protein